MILTYSICFILLALIAWGFKFYGFGHNFNTGFSEFKYNRSLRGITILAILIHHISVQQIFKDSGQLRIFEQTGIYLVSIFFFSSGYGLIKSIDTKPDYLNTFLKQRFLKKLVIPFYLCTVLYGLYFIISGAKLPVSQLLFGLSGLTLLNEHLWYLVVLMILYLVFYVAFYNISHRDDCFAVIFVLIFLMILVFCGRGHIAWWKGPSGWILQDSLAETYAWYEKPLAFWFHGEWWVNTSITFLAGMIFANNEEKIMNWFKRKYWIKLAGILVLFGFSIVIGNGIFSIFDYYSDYIAGSPCFVEKLICVVTQQVVVLLFVVLLYVLQMKIVFSNPVAVFFGNHSLEIYLMNRMMLEIFNFLLVDKKNFSLYVVLVLITTVGAGLAFNYLCKIIRKLIK